MNVDNYPDFHSKGRASCTYVDPDMFFTDPKEPEYHRNSQYSKKICQSCVYKIECLTWALEANEVGIWGGTNEMERRKMKRRRVTS